MDDIELAELMVRLRRQGTDDATTEVKASAGNLPAGVWPTVSAFANTHGGRIVLGVSEQDGFVPVEGFALQRVLDQFVDGMGRANESGAKLERAPSFEMHRLEFEGKPVLVIDIAENAPGRKPCFLKSRGEVKGSYRRIDDKDVVMTPAEVFELNNMLVPSAADREVVPEAVLEDLDPRLLDKLKESRRRSKALTGVTDEPDLLRRLNVINRDGDILLSALLTLGLYPQQFFPRLLVDVVVHPTVEGASADGQLRFLDRQECEGPLPDLVAQAEEAVRRNLRTHSVIRGVGRQDELEIPPEVIREAVANALVHREYHGTFRGEPVSVDIYPDRVTVTSPGGLWGGKTIETIDDGQSKCRNQTLMQLVQHVPMTSDEGRVAEGQGGGVQMMNKMLTARALGRADFRGTSPDRVRVTLRRHGVEVPEIRVWLRGVLPREASPEEETAVILARRDRHVDVTSLHRALGYDSGEIRGILRGLAGEGVLRTVGPEDYVLGSATDAPTGMDAAVLNVLSPTEPLSIRDISAATGRPVESLRHTLRKLISVGAVEATAPPSSRRRRYLRRGDR